MSENISALIDKEVDDNQHTALLDELCKDPVLKDRWEHYQLIRSAIRGDCTRAYLRSIYGTREQHNSVADFTVPETVRHASITAAITNRFRQFRASWVGGFGLAAGLSAAVALGFFSSSLINVQFGHPERVAVDSLYNQASTVRWVSQANLDATVGTNVEFLNQTLLAHSESTSFPSLNGLSNYARLVVYER